MELQFGEGGDDSKNFVDELFSAYARYAKSLNLKMELLQSSFGHITAQVNGQGAGRAFARENGQHVVQRVPPNEHGGRRHTSVISVGVLSLPPVNMQKSLPESELDITCALGTGPGGQHRQKTASCVRAKHKPTGLQVVIDGRDQHQNRKVAIRILTAKVNEFYINKEKSVYDAERRQKMGDGGRGQKVRTYNFIRGKIVDHTLNTCISIKEFERGNFSKLFRVDAKRNSADIRTG